MFRLFILAALGATLWFGFDSIHVRAGIFAVQGSSGVPAWMVLCYFAGFLGVGLFFRALEARSTIQPVTVSRLAIEILAFLTLLAAHYVWFSSELVYAAITGSYLAGRLLLRREPGDFATVAFVALLDLGVELTLIRLGRFSYAHSHWLPVPLWLSPMWGGLGLSVRRFFRFAARPLGIGVPAPKAAVG